MCIRDRYKGSNPTTSKMDQSQTSAFFEVQGKVKDFSYAGSVGTVSYTHLDVYKRQPLPSPSRYTAH